MTGVVSAVVLDYAAFVHTADTDRTAVEDLDLLSCPALSEGLRAAGRWTDTRQVCSVRTEGRWHPDHAHFNLEDIVC